MSTAPSARSGGPSSGSGFLRDCLVCPDHASPLEPPSGHDPASGMPWPDGEIRCSEGCVFPVEQGIPRFVERDNYAAAFGLQWRRFRRTQLDSHTGVPLSQRRLERCLGMTLDELRGKKVLEVGSGAGRFTELLVAHCDSVVSADLSDAVDANLENCMDISPYLLVQADLRKPPFRANTFDVVICLGVIQHTPDPEQTIATLAAELRPGGRLVIDHYAYRADRFGALLAFFSVRTPLRWIAKRLSPVAGLRLTSAYHRISDPIRRRTCRYKQLDRLVARIFATSCYYETIPELPPEICREWNELDTHDSLTDWYQHKRKPEQIHATLERLGFVNIWCEKGHRGGNGIEAHAELGRGS